MSVTTAAITAEDLAQMSFGEQRVELVRGEVIAMAPAGAEHGEIAGFTFGALFNFVRAHNLGSLYAAETGFILARNPDTVRAPDVAFVAAERAAQQRGRTGFFEGPPDLAVEVVSPNDTAEDVEAKVLDYLEAGAKMVWIVRPRTRTVTVYRSLRQVQVLRPGDTLDGGDVLPGFTTPVEALFDG
ncbi:MAG: Uma2 family endonuclease [Roseiflexaceae bacterium]|nr:Uma2 family endonuclease [Roseiflexus sp.]MDW8215411.1 Uma2 family endonuclease [Roseiflexaceae bacterium]